jgi:carboxymethylenebutenolidase
MNVFQRYLAEEFAEDYEDGRLSRREALKLIASVTGSLITANAMLSACAPPAANGPSASAMGSIQTTSPDSPERSLLDDPAIEAGAVEFDGGCGRWTGLGCK